MHRADFSFGARPISLSILIPFAGSLQAIASLAEQLPRALARLPRGTACEILANHPGGQDPESEARLSASGIRLLPRETGYGAALRAGIEASTGEYILTMEPGLAHSPFVIPELYAHRHDADILIASRYIRTGHSATGALRRRLAGLGNRLFSAVLDLPVRDLTSSFRLYRRRVFQSVKLEYNGYEALLEVLVRGHAAGYHTAEVPFHYFPVAGGLDATSFSLGMAGLGNLSALWKLRNSIDCADYDERAFRSRIWFQRSWQRRRYKALVGMARDSARVLDIGCGSSQVLEGLPQADACDVRQNKLRYKRRPGRVLVRGSVFELPFPSAAYDAAVFSQVIEHLPHDPRILQEVVRVVRPGGYVIVGTPDYATWWTTVERIYGFVHPHGYADEHITHYTFDTLKAEVEALGCTFVRHAYVWHAELIMMFQKDGVTSRNRAGAKPDAIGFSKPEVCHA